MAMKFGMRGTAKQVRNGSLISRGMGTYRARDPTYFT